MKADINKLNKNILNASFFMCSIIFSQNITIDSNSKNLYPNRLIRTFYKKSDLKNKNNSKFSLSYNYNVVINNGHSNIDNSAEFYAPGSLTELVSFRYEFSYKWIKIELEPYKILYKNRFRNSSLKDTWQYVNNHSHNDENGSSIGFKQSRVVLHYKGIGFSYGMMNHWWGPGLHSSLTLSSNSHSQKTYSFGTFNDINFNKFSFGVNIIVIPYNNINQIPLYFSGLRAKLTYHSNPELTIGFHRTFLSGNFKGNNLSTENLKKEWSIYDATRILFEPLFGQSKVGLDYTIPGTPGFDSWDQVLSGYVQIFFPKDNLLLYLELASDDNRGNLTDLKAHWDHTLGYNIGLRKFFKLSSIKIFFAMEYLNTIITNTNNPNFFRGSPSAANFYIYKDFDYFTYEGRRIGAHSGSSSDDLIFILGYELRKNIYLLSYNKERHGLKYMEFPELKDEISFIYNYRLNQNHRFSITIEYEDIYNFGYVEKKSTSKFIWIGYSFSI